MELPRDIRTVQREMNDSRVDGIKW